MKYVAMAMLGFCGLAVGCGANRNQQKPANISRQEHAAALAKKIREVMTTPELMKLDPGQPFSVSGLRPLRQREAVLLLVHQLVAYGKVAEDALWQLVNDEEESVRRVMTDLLSRSRSGADGQPIPSQILAELNIPLMERALAAKDPTVRYLACGGLGDFAVFSDESLMRVRTSVPMLRELRNDQEQQVRAIAQMACNNILAELTRRAKQPEDRQSASAELEKLQREKW